MNVSSDDSEMQNLYVEIKNLKAKLRLTKSERDTNSKFTTQLNRDMTALQERHNAMIQEKDYYASQLREIKSYYNSEMIRLEQEVKQLTDSYRDTCQAHKDLFLDYEYLKSEQRYLNFEMDILQVDYANEKEAHQATLTMLKGFKRKNRNLQEEANETDRADTKRHQRLVVDLEKIEKERDRFRELLLSYEVELERVGSLCFICREGVKSVNCPKCIEQYCSKCSLTLTECPFCRNVVQREQDEN